MKVGLQRMLIKYGSEKQTDDLFKSGQYAHGLRSSFAQRGIENHLQELSKDNDPTIRHLAVHYAVKFGRDKVVEQSINDPRNTAYVLRPIMAYGKKEHINKIVTEHKDSLTKNLARAYLNNAIQKFVGVK